MTIYHSQMELIYVVFLILLIWIDLQK